MIVGGRDGIPRDIRVRSIVDVWNTPVRVLPPLGDGNSPGSMMPALSAGLRMIANDVSLLPLMVYRELDAAGNAEKARDTAQWQVLHQQPMPGVPASRLWFNVAMGIIGRGASYALKYVDRGEVVGLEYMYGRVERSRGGGGWDWYPEPTRVIRNIPRDRVIHWPGLSFDGSDEGVSLLDLHKVTFETGSAQQEYQRAFYQNGARPDVWIKHPSITNETQAEEYLDKYESRYRGARNRGRPAVVPANVDIQVVPFSFEDAQFVESKVQTIREVEQILLMPHGMLAETTNPLPGAELKERYLRQSISWILNIIEETLEADPDLFGVGSKLYPEFETGAFLQADMLARYQAYTQARQAGWLSVNDVRAKENEPPIEGGDEYQVTPVGGAPNLQPSQEIDQ